MAGSWLAWLPLSPIPQRVIICYFLNTVHTAGVRSIVLDRLTGLEVFAKVASSGSLSAAARAMGLSQTMVTKHVAALEARLGVKLFHRTTRKLSITEAGRNYLEASERILAEMEVA